MEIQEQTAIRTANRAIYAMSMVFHFFETGASIVVSSELLNSEAV